MNCTHWRTCVCLDTRLKGVIILLFLLQEQDKKKKKKSKGIVTMERDSDFKDIAAAGRGDYDESFYEEDFI